MRTVSYQQEVYDPIIYNAYDHLISDKGIQFLI